MSDAHDLPDDLPHDPMPDHDAPERHELDGDLDLETVVDDAVEYFSEETTGSPAADSDAPPPG